MQLEQIKNIIIDSQIRRLTNIETHTRLRELGIDISIPTIKNYRVQIKVQAAAWIAKLAKSRRGAYIAQYRERIFEIEAIQKKLWDIIADQTTGRRTQVEASRALLSCTNALVQLYDCMPLVNALREYDAQEHSRYQSRQSETDNNNNNSDYPGGIYPR